MLSHVMAHLTCALAACSSGSSAAGALAMAVGLALALPAAWVEFSGRYDAWWVEGLALVVGATGLALLLDRPDRARARTGSTTDDVESENSEAHEL